LFDDSDSNDDSGEDEVHDDSQINNTSSIITRDNA